MGWLHELGLALAWLLNHLALIAAYAVGIPLFLVVGALALATAAAVVATPFLLVYYAVGIVRGYPQWRRLRETA